MDLHRPILYRSVGSLQNPTVSAWNSGNVPEFQSWTCIGLYSVCPWVQHVHGVPAMFQNFSHGPAGMNHLYSVGPWAQNPTVHAWNSGNVPEFQPLGLTGRCSRFQFQSSSSSVSQWRFSRITSTWLRSSMDRRHRVQGRQGTRATAQTWTSFNDYYLAYEWIQLRYI